jgi:hypothetical protein
MSASAPLDHPDAQAQLQAWRREGAWRADPARFHYLEALAQRLQVQGAGVREQLLVKLHSGMADYAQRLAQAREAVATEAAALLAHKPALSRQLRSLQAVGDLPGLKRLAAQATGELGCAPLAQLNATLAQASPTLREAQAAGTDAAAVAGREELSAVRRFRRVWASGRSQDQLARASTRKPVNAGPLNSHALVLQALDLMQELSPDYLRHFLLHVESLQWLQAVRDAPPPVVTGGKVSKRRRSAG